jgi:redox-sensitive bicupin YhaK (pirin superfamily)
VLYVFGMIPLTGAGKSFTITDFWRWWVVHLWVEQSFEFFAASMSAYLLMAVGLVSRKLAERAVYFELILIFLGGVIGPGDVQWMTAAGGILHEEFHSQGFTRSGGPFRMIQLWVNLPAKDKMSKPGHQTITDSDIPVADLPDGAGRVRVIAGEFNGRKGPARTFTPINLWDVRLNRDAAVTLDLPRGHTTMVVVVSGRITVNGTQDAGEAEMVLLDRDGDSATIDASSDAIVLVLTGEPIDEPIVGYGPFVMNSEAEIRQAVEDFNAGRFGAIAHA